MRVSVCKSLVVLLVVAMAPACAGPAESSGPRGKITIIEPQDDPDLFVIERERYEAAIARGPSWFIQQVRVQPVVVARRFRGFMLTQIFHSQEAHGLVAGDIVQRVNGLSIERPGQFMNAWNKLKGAEHLKVQIVRDRRPLELTWVIR